VVDLPTERRAGCPVGGTQGTNDKQDHDSQAADFCAGAKMRVHIGAHGNTFSKTPSESMLDPIAPELKEQL
jgi:hypothetical protein